MDEGNPFLDILAHTRRPFAPRMWTRFRRSMTRYPRLRHVGTWSMRGLAGWRGMAADWFSSLGHEGVDVTYDDARSDVTADLAIGHAILTYTAIAPDGTRLRFLSNRATMALRKSGGSWKIFHEHTSAPIDHRSHQAILQRGDS